ncbi:MAG TPA: amidohydrolase family protein [archaeon]|nr:amidohydrolase family protein [archaeon]
MHCCRSGTKPLICQVLAWLSLSSLSALAQTAPVIGLHQNTPQVVALENARVVVAPGKVLEKAVLVVRDGHIAGVGPGLEIPPDAVKRDLKGKTVYPGFIDLFTSYGIPKTGGQGAGPQEREKGADSPGARHWNPAVRSEARATELFRPDEKMAQSLRQSGFTSVVTYPPEGIFRGSGALVLLTSSGADQAVLEEDLAQALSFNKGPGFNRSGVEGYPSSLMGHIALIRQTFLDALWYERAWLAFGKAPAGQTAPETNLSLAALQPYVHGAKPVLVKAEHELDLLRAAEISREFKLEMWVAGTGYEYRRLEAVKRAGLRLILPLDFPGPPDLGPQAVDAEVSLRELRHWDFAPENPARLKRAGVVFALTSARLEKPEEFLKNLRRAVKRGLEPEAAMAAVTTTPAAWLGVSRLVGTLEKGKLANLIITDGDLFSEKTKIIETWVAGKPYKITPVPLIDARGTWKLNISSRGRELEGSLEISGQPEKLKASLELGGKKVKAEQAALDKRLLTLVFPSDSLGMEGLARFYGTVQKESIQGRGSWGDGSLLTWQARLAEPFKEQPDTTEKEDERGAGFEVVYPEGAFGRTGPPEQPAELLVKGATIWTCGPGGKLENADLLIKKGKIATVGKNLTSGSGALVIEAAGKHVTPGLIDPHSHLAISGGVNEATHAVTSEVRIEDVIDCDDIDIYHQLAGGLTAALLLHGSANPIGGQNALVKLRWGSLPDEMLFHDGWPTIKFALGENVTQAGRPVPDRYPGSRMGVEQLFRDWFRAAKDYRRRWELYNAGKEKNPDLIPPRKDLRLEALLEVLDSKRQVQCHAYRQDEVLAMMRVADDLGFKIGLFIHILEGYKIAEAMARHGAMPTTFSDWWAYKFEVYDAIPYNGALMYEQGLLVSFNSDNQELARRMNLEAAKAVKYGGVPQEEALKFVTLNPARQLGVGHRTGSLEAGKDADFVIWSGNPLSAYTVCQETWIDGKRYFSIGEDRGLRSRAERERVTLVQKILRGSAGKK